MEKILFGAGCFWGIEEAFKKLSGVSGTRVGYSGGDFENPSYKDVCRGDTGHAEVVEVTFNPEDISLDSLFDCFWSIHNPTTKNRQGPDIGSQYRSAIYCYGKDQLDAAIKSKERRPERPIVTEITLAGPFYEAEEYHQCYFEKNR